MNTMTRFGRNIRRVEDERLITGRGRYVGNIATDGVAELVFVRSPHAHAEITGLDVSAARTAPGVIAVYTVEDLEEAGIGAIGTIPMFKRADGSDIAAPPRFLLAKGRVRHVGEPVVAIVAQTKAQALDAAELVVVDYDTLPAVVDMEAAIAGAVVLCPAAPDNIGAEIVHGDAAAVDAAFAAAAHVVSLDIMNQRLVANAMEPRSILAMPEKDRIAVYNASQAPTLVQDFLSQSVLMEPAEAIHVVVGDIGGGFGMKASVHNEEAVTVFAARKLGQAVRFIAERGEEFASSVHGRDQASKASLALDAQGKILGLRVDTLANLGAYIMPVGLLIPFVLGPKILPGTYHVPSIHVRIRGVLTNTMSTAAYRGAGRPESLYIIERLMDAAAAKSGIGAAEIRRRNFIQPAAMPATTIMGEVYDCGNFPYFLEQALARADDAGFAARRAEAEARGKKLGRGITSYVEWTGAYAFTETVDVTVTGDHRVIVHSATQAMGQGLETAYTQLIADRLGVDPMLVSVVQGDTDIVMGPGSYGSRSAFVGGSAVAHGADTWVETALPLAAEALEAANADIVFGQGAFTISGTDRGIGIFDLAGKQAGGQIAIKATHTVENSSWPNGCHIAEVEIDPDTGVSDIKRYTTVDDVGNAINQMLVEGQIHGGIAQGTGQALHEICRYDSEGGQLVTGSFMDYQMPRAADFPSFDVTIDQSVPCTTNMLGVKGCGESGTVAATPTIINAMLDALRPLGVSDLPMPATPFAVWEAVQAARA
ncbi:MAG: xanthine dehydrogenase family protein molybdopterin-binding subunit [Acidocella sp.]|nr:xanthine dehydrogenase family protein molybdopterin-binding subunit [Acidocella sp.]